MNRTTIISTWIAEPEWTDGWPALRGSVRIPRPSVWLIDPRRADTVWKGQYPRILDATELARAARFHQPAHRIRYLTAHTALRTVLAGATHADAASLRFERGHHHKPKLSANQKLSVTFNLSYTENKSMIGINDGTAIGVDIEWLNRPLIIDEMLTACFSTREINYITSQQANMHYRFFTLWTRKEAILKLTGEGIGEHLPLVEVLDGTCVARKEIIGGNPSDTIYLYSFRIGDEQVGCYAASESLEQLSFFRL